MKLSYLFLALLVATNSFAQEYSVTKLGDEVPAFRFEIEKGQFQNITDHKGKLVLINLFATWCPPCRLELPEMQKQIWNKYQHDSRFALFVFGREEGWEVLESFKKKHKYGFPILPDPKRDIFSKFASQSIPRNILIDESGKIIYQSEGYDEIEFANLVSLIDKKLLK